MKSQNGFTLIELVIVVVILAIIAAVAIPKFVDLASDAKLSTMRGIKASIISARDLTFTEAQVKPQNLSTNRRGLTRFTLDDGNTVRLMTDYPDGLWRNNFEHLIFISGVEFVNSNNCETDGDWCVRNRGSGWFTNRNDYSDIPGGRGFVIYPNDSNLNQDKCYIYYYTPNNTNTLAPLIPIVGIDDTDC